MRLLGVIFTGAAALLGLAVACPGHKCFQEHCWSHSIDQAPTFQASCQDLDVGVWIWSNSLDLDMCIGNENGKLVWKDDGHFSESTSDLHIESRPPGRSLAPVVMAGKCQGPDGEQDCNIMLSDGIFFVNGQLSCAGKMAMIELEGPNPNKSLERNTLAPLIARDGEDESNTSLRTDMAVHRDEDKNIDDGPPFDPYRCPWNDCIWEHCRLMSVTEAKNIGDSPIVFTTICEDDWGSGWYWNYLTLDRCLANDHNWIVFEKNGNFQETCKEHWVERLDPVDEDDHDPPFVVIEADCLWRDGSIWYSVGSLSSGVWFERGRIGCPGVKARSVKAPSGDASQKQVWDKYQDMLAKGEFDDDDSLDDDVARVGPDDVPVMKSEAGDSRQDKPVQPIDVASKGDKQ